MNTISFLCFWSLMQLCAAHQNRHLQQVYMSSSLTLNKTGAGVARLEQQNFVKTNNKYSFVKLNNRGVSIIYEDIKTSVYQHLVTIQNVDESDSGVCNNLESRTSETAVVIARAISSAYIRVLIDVQVRYAKVVSKIEGVALAIAQAFVQAMIDVTVQAINEFSAAQAGAMLTVFVEDIQQAVAKTLTEIEVVSTQGKIVTAQSQDESFSQGLAEALAAIMYQAFAKVNGCDNPDAGSSADVLYEGELTQLDDYVFDATALADSPSPVPTPPPKTKTPTSYEDQYETAQQPPTETPEKAVSEQVVPVPATPQKVVSEQVTPVPATPTPTLTPAQKTAPDEVLVDIVGSEKAQGNPVVELTKEQRKALREERKLKRALNQQRLAERRAKLLANQQRKQKLYEKNQAKKAKKQAQRRAQKKNKN